MFLYVVTVHSPFLLCAFFPRLTVCRDLSFFILLSHFAFSFSVFTGLTAASCGPCLVPRLSPTFLTHSRLMMTMTTTTMWGLCPFQNVPLSSQCCHTKKTQRCVRNRFPLNQGPHCSSPPTLPQLPFFQLTLAHKISILTLP